MEFQMMRQSFQEWIACLPGEKLESESRSYVGREGGQGSEINVLPCKPTYSIV